MNCRAHNLYDESHWVSCLRENFTSSSNGEGLETGFTVPRQSFTRQTMFRACKSSGFNIEDTHLTDPDRLSKMLALLCVAFIWVYLVGIARNNAGPPIEIKKHGRKAFSLFKFGLIFLAHALLNPLSIKGLMSCIQILSCT